MKIANLLPTRRTASKVLAKTKDASGHEHGKDGKFTSSGGHAYSVKHDPRTGKPFAPGTTSSLTHESGKKAGFMVNTRDGHHAMSSEGQILGMHETPAKAMQAIADTHEGGIKLQQDRKTGSDREKPLEATAGDGKKYKTREVSAANGGRTVVMSSDGKAVGSFAYNPKSNQFVIQEGMSGGKGFASKQEALQHLADKHQTDTLKDKAVKTGKPAVSVTEHGVAQVAQPPSEYKSARGGTYTTQSKKDSAGNSYHTLHDASGKHIANIHHDPEDNKYSTEWAGGKPVGIKPDFKSAVEGLIENHEVSMPKLVQHAGKAYEMHPKPYSGDSFDIHHNGQKVGEVVSPTGKTYKGQLHVGNGETHDAGEFSNAEDATRGVAIAHHFANTKI